MAEGKKIGTATLDIAVDDSKAVQIFKQMLQTGEKVGDTFKKVADTIDSATTFVEGMGKEASKTTNELKNAGKSAKKMGESAAEGVKKANQQVVSTKEAVSNLKSSINGVKETFRNMGSAIVDAIKSPIQKIKEIPATAKQAASQLKGFIQSGFAQAKNLAISQINKIVTSIKDIPTKSKNALNSVKNVFKSGFATAVNTAANSINRINSFINSIPSRTKSAVTSLKTSFVNGFKNIVDSAKSTASNVIDKIKSIPSSAVNAAKNLKNSFSNGFNGIKSSAKEAVDNAKTKLKELKDSGEETGLSIKKIVTALGLLKIAAAALNVVKTGISNAIQRIDTIDVATKSLTVLTGNAKDAELVMTDLALAIEGTPIALNDVALGAKKMVAAGMQAAKVKDVFTAIADAAYGVGNGAESIDQITDAIASMQSAGVVYSDDINRLVDAGIPAWQMLANQAGVSVTEMKESVSSGALDSETAINNLVRGIENGTNGIAGETAKMAGLAKTAGDTLSGSFSNMKTAITTTFTAILTPFKDFMIGALQKATENIKKFRDEVIKSEKVQEVFAKINEVLSNFGSYLDLINKKVPFLIPLLKSLAAGVATFIAIVGTVSVAAFAWKTLTAIIAKTGFTLLATPFGTVAAIIVGLAVAFTQAYKKSETFRKAVDKLLEPIKKVASAISILAKAFKAFFTFDLTGLSQLKEELTGLLGAELAEKSWGIFLKISWAIQSVINAFKGLIGVVKGDFKTLTDLKDYFDGSVPDGLTNGIFKAGKLIGSGIETIKDAFGKLKDAVATAITEKDFTPLLNIVKKIIPSIALAIVGGVPALVGKDVLIISKIAEGMGMTIPELFEKAGEIILGFIEQLSTWLTTHLPKILEIGLQILTGIIEGITTALPEILNAALAILMTITTAIVENLQILLEAGITILTAIIEGIVSILPTLLEAALSLLSALATTLIENLPIIIEAGIKILLALINGIVQILPDLIAAAIMLIAQIASTIIQNLPTIIAAGVKILLAIAKGIIDTIVKLVEELPKVFKAIFDAFGEVDWLKLGKDIINGLIDGIGAVMDKLKKKVTGVADNVVGWFKDKMGIESPSKVMAEQGKYTSEGVGIGITSGQSKVKDAISGVTSVITGVFNGIGSVINTAQLMIEGAKAANSLVSGFKLGIVQLPSIAADAINRFINSMVGASAKALVIGIQIGNLIFAGIKTGVSKTSSIGTQVVNILYSSLLASSKRMLLAGTLLMISFGNGILSMRSTVLAKVSAILLAIYTLIMSYRVRLLTAGKALMTQLAIGIQTMNSLVRARSNEIGNTIYNTTMSFRGRMQSAGQSLISSLATGIRNSTGQVSSAMRSVSGAMLNAISKGINGSISGVNHVLGQLGSSKKISSWTIPAYKQGTTGHPEDGPAIVNDGSGPYQEAYITPEGKMGLFPRIKNLLVPMMRRGTQIIKGSTVAKMKKHIPAYAEGTDDFDIYDYLDKPKELLEKATAMKTNLSGVVEPWLNMTKSAMALIVTEALPMIEEEIANLMPTGAGSRGEFIRLVLAQEGKQYVWGAEGPNTFDCSGLIMWALGQIGIPFPHYTGAQWNATEHITEKEAVAGDLIYFGNGASRHVGMYTKPGQMFHASSPNAFGPGNGIGYGSYAASDLWGFARIRELAASVSNVASLAGGAVNRWVPYIKKAAAVMKVKLTNADMQAILAQIQLESGGNEKIRQQIYDVNSYNGSGGAKGLLQFIDSTFLNYAMPGHKNIFSGYDQLLAMFNIPNYRRFVRGISGWSPYGARRFENGGWITKDGLYRAGENDNPEIVLPLTKPRRAIDLIIQALSYINGGGLSGSVSSGLSALSEGLDATLANMKSLAIGSLVATSEIIVQTASGTALGANEYASIDSGSIIQAIYDLAETIQKMKVEMDGREVGKIVAPVVKSTNERNENFRKHLRGE